MTGTRIITEHVERIVVAPMMDMMHYQLRAIGFRIVENEWNNRQERHNYVLLAVQKDGEWFKCDIRQFRTNETPDDVMMDQIYDAMIAPDNSYDKE